MAEKIFIRSRWGLIVGARELESALCGRIDRVKATLTLEFQPRKAPLIRTELFRIGYWTQGRFMPMRPREPATRVYSLPICSRDMLLGLGFAEVDDIRGCAPRPHLKLYKQLYDNQAILVDAITDIIQRDKSCYCDVRAGAGKTRMAGAIFARLNAVNALYVVPRVDLARQTFDDLVAMLFPQEYIGFLREYVKFVRLSRRKFTPRVITELLECITAIKEYIPSMPKFMMLPRVGLGSIIRREHAGGPITPITPSISIMTIHSAMLLDDNTLGAFDMIILDEAHEYVSSARHDFIARAGVQWKLAMSATVADRSDGLDPVIQAHFCPGYRRGGPNGIVRAENIPGFTYDEVKFDARAKVIHYYGPDTHIMNLKNRTTGELSPLLMREMFMRDEARLQIIMNELLRLYNWVGPDSKQHHIYIYCEEKDSVQVIYHYVKTHSNIDSEAPELFTFTGGCRNGTEVRNYARVIITTYGYAGTGTSIPKMTAMILATSRRAKLKQVLGRCLRRNGDITITREYIYICDDRTFLRAQLSANLTAFQHYDIPVKHVKIRHDSVVVNTANTVNIATAIGYDLDGDCDDPDGDDNDLDDLDDDDPNNDDPGNIINGPSVIDDE